MNDERPFEWGELAQAWAGERVEDDLRKRILARIRRRTLLLRVTMVGELLVLVGLAWMSRWYLGSEPSGAQIALIAVTWTWAVGVFTFALWNRRESWRADTTGIEGYLALMERRARASLRTASVVVPLAVVQGVVVLGLLGASATGPGARSSAWVAEVALLGATVGAAAAFARWLARAARRELAEVAETRAVRSEDEVAR